MIDPFSPVGPVGPTKHDESQSVYDEYLVHVSDTLLQHVCLQKDFSVSLKSLLRIFDMRFKLSNVLSLFIFLFIEFPFKLQ